MTPAPPTAWRAIWLLTRLRLQRLLNVSGRGLAFKKTRQGRRRPELAGLLVAHIKRFAGQQ